MTLSLPSKMIVAEVGPRDGLQSFPRWIDTATKVLIIDRAGHHLYLDGCVSPDI